MGHVRSTYVRADREDDVDEEGESEDAMQKERVATPCWNDELTHV
jgi:hypothetical protein